MIASSPPLWQEEATKRWMKHIWNMKTWSEMTRSSKSIFEIIRSNDHDANIFFTSPPVCLVTGVALVPVDPLHWLVVSFVFGKLSWVRWVIMEKRVIWFNWVNELHVNGWIELIGWIGWIGQKGWMGWIYIVYIWQGLRRCRKLSAICQQNSDAS